MTCWMQRVTHFWNYLRFLLALSLRGRDPRFAAPKLQFSWPLSQDSEYWARLLGSINFLSSPLPWLPLVCSGRSSEQMKWGLATSLSAFSASLEWSLSEAAAWMLWDSFLRLMVLRFCLLLKASSLVFQGIRQVPPQNSLELKFWT